MRGEGKFAEQKDGIEPFMDGRDRLSRKEEEGKARCLPAKRRFAQRRRGKSSLSSRVSRYCGKSGKFD